VAQANRRSGYGLYASVPKQAAQPLRDDGALTDREINVHWRDFANTAGAKKSAAEAAQKCLRANDLPLRRGCRPIVPVHLFKRFGRREKASAFGLPVIPGRIIGILVTSGGFFPICDRPPVL